MKIAIRVGSSKLFLPFRMALLLQLGRVISVSLESGVAGPHLVFELPLLEEGCASADPSLVDPLSWASLQYPSQL